MSLFFVSITKCGNKRQSIKYKIFYKHMKFQPEALYAQEFTDFQAKFAFNMLEVHFPETNKSHPNL